MTTMGNRRVHTVLQALKAAQMESRLLQQERLAQESESRAAQMEARIVELQRMLEGGPCLSNLCCQCASLPVVE